jgi:hypothetical protein
MKYLFAAVLVASSVAGFSAANAEGGCGPGMHRGAYGHCRPMAAPPSWWCRERSWLSARSWWGPAAAVARDSPGVPAAAARSERSVTEYDKAPLARGFVFAW